MGAFFVYILKTSVCLAGFYLFYRLLLSRETFHRFNRFALLGVLFLALAIPCYESSVKPATELQRTIAQWEQSIIPQQVNPGPVRFRIGASEASAASLWSWQKILLAIYLTGVLFFFFRNIYSLFRMARLLRKSDRIKIGEGIVLVTHDQNLSPFSWMKQIVVSRSDLSQSKGEILIHEREHIRLYHSLDLLLAEIVILFQWFNPAAWLFRQELQNLHEYQADEAVLSHGIDAKQYQLLLIKKAVDSVRFNSLANSFYHSKLKKRITMMLKRKSNPWVRLKYLYVLPLTAVAVALFARSGVAAEFGQISTLKVNDFTSDFKDKAQETDPGLQDSDVLPFPFSGNRVEELFKSGRADFSRPDGEPDPRIAGLETFLQNHPRCRIVRNDVEVSPENFRSGENLTDCSIKTYIGKDAKSFGKSVEENGLVLINTTESFFKNVILKGGSLEAAQKVLDRENAILILDGEQVACKSLSQIRGDAITLLKIKADRVYVTTDVGRWVRKFVKTHPDAFTILKGREIEARELKRADYIGEETILTYYGDESDQFGPKARNGSLFVGIMSNHYQLENWKKDHNAYLFSKYKLEARIDPDSLMR